MLIAGVLAADSIGWGVQFFAASVAACLLADTIWFYAGRKYGKQVISASFLGFTGLGSMLWVGAYMLIGACFAPELEKLEPLANLVAGTAALLAGLSLCAYLAYRWRRPPRASLFKSDTPSR